ncbi:MAG TPA: hypothetical protein ENJ37_00505 [Deltaproteobacteria bacterium]|nr:hypothetical protein [Deltaproteobacteria bacterium]
MVNREYLEKTSKATRYFAAALVFVILIYLGLVMLGRNVYIYFKGYGGGVDPLFLRFVFYGAALSSAAVVEVYKKRQLSAARLAGLLDDQGAMVRHLLSTAFISLALSNIPAVCGLLIYFFGLLFGDFFVLAGFSLVLLAYNIPTVRYWERRIAAAAAEAGRGDVSAGTVA